MQKPIISILCPSYNHERFIADFIDSVLSQTEQNFEIIIVDDYSSDKNIAAIQKFSDLRIKLIKRNYNQGINAGLNDAFKAAKGEYCAFIASDDIMEPNYLETAIRTIEDNHFADTFYCALSVIDENGNFKTNNKDFLANPNQSRFEVLRRLFLRGNILTSPGMVVRKNALKEIMPLDISMLQHQDYQMHINLLLRGEALFSTEKLIRYRKISGNKNISAPTFPVIKRENLEQSKLMDSFLQIKEVDLLEKIFNKDLEGLGNPAKETIPYFLGRLALRSDSTEKQNWGYRTIMEFISEKKNLELLHNSYDFNFGQYINLVKNFKIDDEQKNLKKYKKYKRLFNISLLICLLSSVSLAFNITILK
jgi:glycosyltransferase involved in cell wall biosynthesis